METLRLVETAVQHALWYLISGGPEL